jgi:hypothetical protein
VNGVVLVEAKMKAIVDVFADPRGYPYCDEEAQSFSKPFGRDLKSWWKAAPQANWMILLAGASLVSEARLLQAMLECVRTGLHFIPDTKRPAVESFLALVERAIEDKVTADECLKASDEVSDLQREILDACNMGDSTNSLAAARATGAVATAIASAAIRQNRDGRVLVMHSAVSQVAAAGYSEGGTDARSAIHLQCARIVRRCIRADELVFPEVE